MDLSFTQAGQTIRLGQVQLDDLPRAATLLRQSLQHPPLFEADGLDTLRMISTDELYERYLAVSKHIRTEPVTNPFDMNQLGPLERTYLYRAELYRRTHEVSPFVRAYEAFTTSERSTQLPKYNDMLLELEKDIPLVFETYEEQKRTKECMLDIVRRPQVLAEIHRVVRIILGKVDRSQFKYYLTPSQRQLIMTGSVEDEPLEVQEGLLLNLQRMRETL